MNPEQKTFFKQAFREMMEGAEDNAKPAFGNLSLLDLVREVEDETRLGRAIMKAAEVVSYIPSHSILHAVAALTLLPKLTESFNEAFYSSAKPMAGKDKPIVEGFSLNDFVREMRGDTEVGKMLSAAARIVSAVRGHTVHHLVAALRLAPHVEGEIRRNSKVPGSAP